MAKVIITVALREEMLRRFKAPAADLFLRFKSLETNPLQGKAIGHVGGVIIKELKFEKYRFYFVTDGHMLKFGTREELAGLIIKFVRMSEKNDRQKKIAEIKRILTSMGFEGF